MNNRPVLMICPTCKGEKCASCNNEGVIQDLRKKRQRKEWVYKSEYDKIDKQNDRLLTIVITEGVLILSLLGIIASMIVG